MVSSDLGACEWFVWDLRRSGLIDRGHLDQVVGEFLERNPRAEPPGLAEYLVSQSVLTPFQSERILQGKTQGLVLGPYILRTRSAPAAWDRFTKLSPRRTTSGTPSRSCRAAACGMSGCRDVRCVLSVNSITLRLCHSLTSARPAAMHYLVWPLVEGETLETRVMREGRLSTEAVC